MFNLPGPNSLLLAQMATYSKGQENQARFSGEKEEQDHKLHRQIMRDDSFQRSEETAPGAQEGSLA
jgi:hypothetical protein